MPFNFTNKTKKKVLSGVILFSSVALLSGCSLFDRSERVATTGVTIETNVNSLDEDSFYTYNGKEYGKLYLGDRNFKSSNSVSASNNKGNPGRVIWLQDDIKSIPIMKRGDKLVYHSSERLVSFLSVERFYDLGWSIGIAGLKGDKTGRYSLSMRENSLSVDPNSDARSLQNITTSDVIVIDSIGKTPLRSGNVSASGTIIGLEKDKTYSINAYLGTNLHQNNIKADVQILASSESDRINNFEFSESRTVEFTFPNYYNSGYYLVNGFGLVRYIAEDTVDENNIDKIDMNVPNIYPKDGEEGVDVAQKNFDAEDLTSTTISVEEDGEQQITISYGDTTEEGVKAPTAKLISPDGASSFVQGEGNTLTLSTTLQKGEYEVQIIGLKGRTYSYRVKSAASKDEDKPSEEATESPTASSEQEEKPKSLADIVNGN